jgi:ABC-type methionine transport system permease subunit
MEYILYFYYIQDLPEPLLFTKNTMEIIAAAINTAPPAAIPIITPVPKKAAEELSVNILFEAVVEVLVSLPVVILLVDVLVDPVVLASVVPVDPEVE